MIRLLTMKFHLKLAYQELSATNCVNPFFADSIFRLHQTVNSINSLILNPNAYICRQAKNDWPAPQKAGQAFYIWKMNSR